MNGWGLACCVGSKVVRGRDLEHAWVSYGQSVHLCLHRTHSHPLLSVSLVYLPRSLALSLSLSLSLRIPTSYLPSQLVYLPRIDTPYREYIRSTKCAGSQYSLSVSVHHTEACLCRASLSFSLVTGWLLMWRITPSSLHLLPRSSYTYALVRQST